MLLSELSIKLHFNTRELSRYHVRGYISKTLLYFNYFFLAKTRRAGLVILFEVLYLLQMVITPLNSLFVLGLRFGAIWLVAQVNGSLAFWISIAVIINRILK